MTAAEDVLHVLLSAAHADRRRDPLTFVALRGAAFQLSRSLRAHAKGLAPEERLRALGVDEQGAAVVSLLGAQWGGVPACAPPDGAVRVFEMPGGSPLDLSQPAVARLSAKGAVLVAGTVAAGGGTERRLVLLEATSRGYEVMASTRGGWDLRQPAGHDAPAEEADQLAVLDVCASGREGQAMLVAGNRHGAVLLSRREGELCLEVDMLTCFSAADQNDEDLRSEFTCWGFPIYRQYGTGSFAHSDERRDFAIRRLEDWSESAVVAPVSPETPWQCCYVFPVYAAPEPLGSVEFGHFEGYIHNDDEDERWGVEEEDRPLVEYVGDLLGAASSLARRRFRECRYPPQLVSTTPRGEGVAALFVMYPSERCLLAHSDVSKPCALLPKAAATSVRWVRALPDALVAGGTDGAYLVDGSGLHWDPCVIAEVPPLIWSSCGGGYLLLLDPASRRTRVMSAAGASPSWRAMPKKRRR
jgi:hypothetical protein